MFSVTHTQPPLVNQVDNLFVFNPPLCTDDNLVWSCRQPKACLAKSSAAAVANPKQALSYLSSCQARQIAVAPSTAGAGSASDDLPMSPSIRPAYM